MHGSVHRIVNAVAVVLVLAIAVALVAKTKHEKSAQFVTIGTGSVSGLYYPTGGAIAKLVNRKYQQYGFRAVVEATEGSADNLNGILSNQLDFGIVQADLEYQAVHGQGEWFVKGPQKALRAICGLHREIVTVVATDASGIQTLTDLRGKRVNIGSKGSGHRKNAIEILSTLGIDAAADFTAFEAKPEEAVTMLHNGEIDAFFYTVGHPNPVVEDATEGPHKVHFVPVASGPVVAALPYFRPGNIPVHLYPQASNREERVETVGLMAVLVSAARVEERYVYAVTMNLFENLEEFKSFHPAFALLSKGTMLEGFSAPLHPGAERYFKQTGDIGSVEASQVRR